jgi:hypothetical protein
MVTLHTVFFEGADADPFWGRMLRVLELSAAEHSPATPLVVHRREGHGGATRAALDPGSASFADNSHKMRLWREIVDGAADGEMIGLIDADMMVTGGLAGAAGLAGDVIYTARPEGARFPLNSGVMFFRVSPRVRRWVHVWHGLNEGMLRDARRHAEWRERYGGINQAAFGETLAIAGELMPEVDVRAVPCAVWNCEETGWADFKVGETRLVHLKGRLRRVLRDGRMARLPQVRRICEMWRRFDVMAGEAAVV